MKLAAVILENFRGYSQSTRIEIDDLTAFIGKNDAGKSTILEALEIFFNDGKPERGDVCVYGTGTTIRISCAFNSLPVEIVLDAAAHTSRCRAFIERKGGIRNRQRVGHFDKNAEGIGFRSGVAPH